MLALFFFLRWLYIWCTVYFGMVCVFVISLRRGSCVLCWTSFAVVLFVWACIVC